MKKKLAVKDKSLCANCLTCEIACSNAFYKNYKEDTSCVKIMGKEDGTLDIKTCVQCGVCAEACPEKAITQNAKTGVYMINKKLCTGCLSCVEACPMGVIVKSENNTNPSKCISCGICVKECPMGVLEITEA